MFCSTSTGILVLKSLGLLKENSVVSVAAFSLVACLSRMDFVLTVVCFLVNFMSKLFNELSNSEPKRLGSRHRGGACSEEEL